MSPETSRSERKKEKTRQHIISAAMRLFAEQGLDATAMEQIAEEADVAKGTLYNYFPSKEVIVSAFVQGRLAEQGAARLQQIHNLPDTRARLTYIFDELVAGVQAQPEIFERFLVYQLRQTVSLHPNQKVDGSLYTLADQIVRLGQQDGEIRADLPVDMIKDLFEFAFIEVAKHFYIAPDSFDVPKVIAWSVDLFLNGVRAP
ncbi:MAG: TetR/AcrR family transcriptional regulator [Chloroflexi bacterium]|nr:TetR/AcrR family transcriptional regulator [Chloroflexota bacterium]